MIKKVFLCLSLILLAVTTVHALPDDKGLPTFEMDVAPPASASSLWFHVGEELHYTIKWGVFNVGTMVASTRWVKHEDGRVFLLIRFETHSNSIIEKLYPITDIQEAFVDPETFLPLYFYKNSIQGKRVYDELVTFDHEKNKAYWDNYARGKKQEIDIEPNSRDLITTIYYLRSPERALDEESKLRVYTDEKIFDMSVSVLKHEKIKLKRYGKIQSVKYEPKAKFEGLFVSKGRMFMWASKDERQVCTKMQAKLPVADVRLVLKKVEGPGDDFWVASDEELKLLRGDKEKKRKRRRRR